MTGIILAGGRSSRFGSDKALAPWNGKTMIESVIDILKPAFNRILIVTKSADRFSFLKGETIEFIRDAFPDHHSMGGLYSGLSASRDTANFVCACDMPFLNAALTTALPRRLDDHDAVVPVWENKPQPLCAAYSTSCLPTLASMIENGNYKIKSVFDRLKTKFLTESEIRELDSEGLSFTDIDTRQEYEELQK